MNKAMDIGKVIEGRAIHLNQYHSSQLPFAVTHNQNGWQMIQDLENGSGQIRVLDASGGYASACFGGVRKEIIEHLAHLAGSVDYSTDELGSCSRSKLLNDLFGSNGCWSDSFPASEYQVSGRNSGSEGMEMALRLVIESRFDYRKQVYFSEHKDRNIIIAFEGAWHGWTSGLLSLLNRRHYKKGLPQISEVGEDGISVRHLPFGDLEALESIFDKEGKRILAVFVEPIQGDAGILMPQSGYLRQMRELCTKSGARLVADEVLTFAKTGEFFAMRDNEGLIPTDITVIGKNLGMGIISTSMVIAKRDLFVRECGAVATSDLRPITCEIIGAGLSLMKSEDLLNNSYILGNKLKSLIDQEIVHKYPQVYREIRGKGFLAGIELTENFSGKVKELRSHLIRSGLFVEFMAGAGRRSHGHRFVFPTMRIAPPLTLKESEIDHIVKALDEGTKRIFNT